MLCAFSVSRQDLLHPYHLHYKYILSIYSLVSKQPCKERHNPNAMFTTIFPPCVSQSPAIHREIVNLVEIPPNAFESRDCDSRIFNSYLLNPRQIGRSDGNWHVSRQPKASLLKQQRRTFSTKSSFNELSRATGD